MSRRRGSESRHVFRLPSRSAEIQNTSQTRMQNNSASAGRLFL